MAKEQRETVRVFKDEYGAGVRQSAVRGRTTKAEVGALPLALSFEAMKGVPQNYHRTHLPSHNLHQCQSCNKMVSRLELR